MSPGPARKRHLRPDLSGGTATLTFDGRTSVAPGQVTGGGLPNFETVELAKGRRHPVRIDAAAHRFDGTDLVWERISRQPDEALAPAAADADLLLAVAGLTSDLGAEETGLHIPGFDGGDKTTLTCRRLCRAAGTRKGHRQAARRGRH